MSNATSNHWCPAHELVCDELLCASRSFEYGIAAAVDITHHVSSLSHVIHGCVSKLWLCSMLLIAL